jgi:AraC-like DNA-binding protein
MLGYAGWYGKQPYREILFYLPLQQLFLLPPVLYFYFKNLFDKSFRFRKIDYLHFLPAILYLIYAFIVFIVDKMVSSNIYFYQDGKDKDFSTWYQIGGFLSLLLYLILSLRLYNRYKFLTFNSFSFAEKLTFKWAQRFLIAFLFLVFIRLLFFIINPEWDEFGRKFWYYLAFSFLFYFISISGYVNSVQTLTSFKDWLVAPNNELKSGQKEVSIKKLDQEMLPELDVWKSRVENLIIIQKMYKNPELSIYDVAVGLETHSKKVSQVVNQGFGMNFNDYVNRQRVKAIIEKFEQGEHSLLTLLGIAMECGFFSKSTFNRAFKKETSLSPKDYIQKIFIK